MTGKARAERGAARRRPAVTLDALVAAGLAVLQRDGLDALSMRSVAAELGVQAPSLYWHVRDKSELLDLLADGLLAAAELPPARGDWRRQLRELAWAYRAFLHERRDAVRVLAGRFPSGPGMARAMEHQLTLLHRGGFARQDAAYITYAMSTLVLGFVHGEQHPVTAAVATGAVGTRDAVDAIGKSIAELPPDIYPHLAASARELTEPSMDPRFEFLVERFLDGLEALPRNAPEAERESDTERDGPR
jgi:TetR/AcrR family tetracycline transcriptional repressor